MGKVPWYAAEICQGLSAEVCGIDFGTNIAKILPALAIGTKVHIQNQVGNYLRRWERSGTIVETRHNEQYLVKVDGTGRLTLRSYKPITRKPGLAPTDPAPAPSLPARPSAEPSNQSTAPTRQTNRLNPEPIETSSYQELDGGHNGVNQHLLSPQQTPQEVNHYTPVPAPVPSPVPPTSPARSPPTPSCQETLTTGRPQRNRRPNVLYKEDVWDLNILEDQATLSSDQVVFLLKYLLEKLNQ